MPKRSLFSNVKLNVAGAVVHYNTFIKKLPVLNLVNKNISFNVYEGPNLCQWNGGRINRDITLTRQMIERYNSFGISVSLTFTNPVIDMNHQPGHDLLYMLNTIGKRFKVKNKVVLVNDDLRKFIRKYYDLELIYSITGHTSEVKLTDDMIQYYKDLETKYDYIVPKFEFVFEPKFYNAVDTSKYELLINDTCVYGCPYYAEHFQKIAEQNNVSKNPWDELGHEHCFKTEECWLPNFDPNVGSEKNKQKYGERLGMNYTRDMIRKSLDLGYNSFKISGRENSTDFIMYETETFCKDINER